MAQLADIREQNRALGRVASILYFVVNNLSKIDPMYQFSLERYKILFSENIDYIEKNSGSDNPQERREKIDELHRKSIYTTYSRCLFSKDQLLLAFSMSVALKKIQGDFD